MRGRSERPKLSVGSKYNSPMKGVIKPGESNGSLSTKPATSTTLNSTQRKTEMDEVRKAKGGRKEP